MSKLTDLVATKIGCGYAWATQGEILSYELLTRLKQKEGAQHYDLVGGVSASKWVGKQVFDCSGLIVWALRQLGVITADYTAETIFKCLCTEIKKPYLRPDDIVFVKNAVGAINHVGVYIGNGQVIEAQSTALGVTKTELERRPFNVFGRLKADLNSIGDFDVYKAIAFLSTVSLGSDKIINSPETWRDDIKKREIKQVNVEALLIKVAKKLSQK